MEPRTKNTAAPFAATQFLHTIGMPKRACVFTKEKTHTYGVNV